jgi:deoxyribonuclease V
MTRADEGEMIPDLEAILRRWIAAIPPGRVTTCGALAELLGDRQAARWVGTWLVEHAHTEDCPCHRVVRAGGRLGRSRLGEEVQRDRLQREGVELLPEGVPEEALVHAPELASLLGIQEEDRPLRQLRTIQEEMRKKVVMTPLSSDPKDCAGVDVSYRGDWAVAVYCRVSWPGGDKLYETSIVERARFPYITSYLAFRELSPMIAVLKKAAREDQLADVIAVDGSGLLHPRGIGIASHLGVVIDRPTIGITKTLLCGHVEEKELPPGGTLPVEWEGHHLGVVLRSQRGHAQPVFLSVGHRIDVEGCIRVVRPLFAQHRLPEPIYWADRLSRAIARQLK